MSRRSKSTGFQITRVGVWYVVAIIVVALAATNTGNNGLFLVVASLAAAFVVAHLAAAWNVRGVAIDVESRRELFANEVAPLDVVVRHRGWLPRWLLVLAVDPADVETVGEDDEPPRRRTAPWLLPLLAPGETRVGQIETLFRRRGLRRLRFIQVVSLFPLGLFRKGRRHPQDLEILVYPELFDSAGSYDDRSGTSGESPSMRPGFGHDLYALREYRPGDDPRSIHWKQTARQRQMIVKQRETDENRRLAIVLDNAVGTLGPAAEKRFERLVSEAATAAVHHLERGFEVSLTTRDLQLPFAAGARQRRLLLEALARLDASPLDRRPLAAPTGGLAMRLALDPTADEADASSASGRSVWRRAG
ncbi:MAG: DUF58 domain-containing protein [Acidobacteriota bacterium]